MCPDANEPFSVDRQPLATTEVEARLLGALLVDIGVFDLIANRVSIDNFSLNEHKTVFQAINDLLARCCPVDLKSVTEELRHTNKLGDAGGNGWRPDMADRSRNGRKVEMATSTKLLGDAGEHYALSQFSFAGKYAAKMPDNWQGYDLAVETGSELVRVSVKTRSETARWKSSPWFNWDDRRVCDWFVFVFKPINGPVRSWVVPSEFVEINSNKPGPHRKDPWFRDLSLKKLNELPLADYEDNWSMEVKELASSALDASC